jgi:NitT/TauT family transport system substrate-binding protein
LETKKRQHKVLAGLVIAGSLLLAAACGGDDGDSDDTTAAPATTEATTETTAESTDTTAESTDTTAESTDTTAESTETTAASTETTTGGSGGELVATTPGCEEHGVTEQALISPEREPARCDPGTPAPQPLAERATLKVSSAFSLEFMSPILLAQSLGEFEKENIEIEMVNVSYADAVPQLAQGTIDASVGGIEIALFNAGNQDLPVRVVLGNYYPPDAGDYDVPQTGLWCRRDAFSDPQNPDPLETMDMTWASSVGKGSISIYYSSTEIAQRAPGFDITDVEVQQIPSADTVTALQNGAIQCGILLDPLWLQVSQDPNYVMMATQTPGEPLGQISFGKNLLEDRPEVGDAFVRAYLRTINTYYNGDYHSNAEVMNEIAAQTGVTVERMTQVPSLTFDWEVREGTTDRAQEFFIKVGVITQFTEPVAEEKLVDRSFYLRAVGAE